MLPYELWVSCMAMDTRTLLLLVLVPYDVSLPSATNLDPPLLNGRYWNVIVQLALVGS